MADFDPYDDGISIVLNLSRVASQQELDAAADLLEEWASHYRAEGRSHRNAGRRGRLGDRRMEIYLDRIVDPHGPAAALEYAEDLARRARTALPVASHEITSADDALDADIEERLGVQRIVVRPGGDAVADLRAARLLPMPPGLRPSVLWVFPLFAARFATSLLDPPYASYAGNAIVVAGVGGLAIASRHWCGRREHALAVAFCLVAAGNIAIVAAAPSNDGLLWAARLASIVLGILWIVTWLGRGKLGSSPR
jgi:hypothetical protein